MKPIIIVCGVPGSGKSWVCLQVANKFNYIKQDEYLAGGYITALKAAAKLSKQVITDCPFGERKVKDELELHGLHILPIFIIEPPNVIQERYEQRTGRPVPKNVLSRATSIADRANEWNALSGSSEQVLQHLKQL